MAGSIKIQHGATASTPQAGFSTLWSKTTSGEVYLTKPNGTTVLIGAEQTSITPIPPTYANIAAAAAAGLTGGDLFKTSAGMIGVVF
jgi:hypothetical protein